MKRKSQFDQSKIIPAQPGWYACDMLVSEDLKKCTGINYVPIIAWAIAESEEMPHGEIGSTITLPIFAVGGPNHALSTILHENECCCLIYKDPDGNFSGFDRWIGGDEQAEADVIELYSKLLEGRNRG